MRATSTGRTRSFALAAAAVLAACRTAAPVASAPPAAANAAPSAPAPLPRADDPSGQMFAAWERAQGGDAALALETLRALDAVGWAVPLDARDWPSLRDDPEFQALAARIAARAPKTPHAALAFTIAEPGLVPEGLAHDPATGALYVGSIRQRKIVRVLPDGTATDFVPSAAHGLLAPLGLKVDAARDLLWAGSMTSAGMVGYAPEGKGRAGLFAFDLATGALRRAVFAPAGDHLLNDLAVAADGTVYVTDSTAGALWRLRPGADALEPVVASGFVYPNGLVLFGDGTPGAKLLVCDGLGITIVPVGDPARPAGAPHAREVEGPRPLPAPAGVPLGGIDGLSRENDAALVAIQNALGTPRIIRLRLDAAAERVTALEVLESDHPRWHVPTTGAVAGDAFVYLGNSFVDGISARGLTPEAAAAPALVFRLPLR